MRYHAFVLHNISRDMFWGFKPETSRLFHAHTFEVEAHCPEQATEIVWILTNVDSPDGLIASRVTSTELNLVEYADQVVRYRQRMNRSLSVGDVVLIYRGEEFLVARACETVGWKDYDPYDAAFITDGAKDWWPLDVQNESNPSQAYDAMQDFLQAQP